MSYDTGAHTVFYDHYHIVWITKYRYKMLKGELGMRIRDIIRQVYKELGVKIIKGVISGDHVHLMVSIPAPLAGSDVVRRMKGRSPYNVQQEYPELKKRYWGRHFWAETTFVLQVEMSPMRSYFSTSRTIPNLPASECGERSV